MEQVLSSRHTVKGRVSIQVLEPRTAFAATHLSLLQGKVNWYAAELERITDNPRISDEAYQELAQTLEQARAALEDYSRRNMRIVRGSRKEWDNLITDLGLTQIASTRYADLFLYCAVGTGNSVPANGQQSLDTEAARTANYLTGAGNCDTTRPQLNQFVLKRTYDFPLGALNGTYAEVGFSPSSSAGPNIFSRSLIQSSGIPTAVTVASTQQLRVVYTLTVTIGSLTSSRDVPNISGWTTVTPSGAVTASQAGTTVTASSAIFAAGDVNKAILWGSGSFAIITAFTSDTVVTVDRSQAVTAGAFSLLSGTEGAISLQDTPGNLISTVATNGLTANGILDPANSNIYAFTSTAATALSVVGSYTDRASGFSSFYALATAQTYTGGYNRNFKLACSVNDSNFTVRSVGLGQFPPNVLNNLVFLFDSGQVKSNLYTLDLLFNMSWGRN